MTTDAPAYAPCPHCGLAVLTGVTVHCDACLFCLQCGEGLTVEQLARRAMLCESCCWCEYCGSFIEDEDAIGGIVLGMALCGHCAHVLEVAYVG